MFGFSVLRNKLNGELAGERWWKLTRGREGNSNL